jgi:hypothetical protein
LLSHPLHLSLFPSAPPFHKIFSYDAIPSSFQQSLQTSFFQFAFIITFLPPTLTTAPLYPHTRRAHPCLYTCWQSIPINLYISFRLSSRFHALLTLSLYFQSRHLCYLLLGCLSTHSQLLRHPPFISMSILNFSSIFSRLLPFSFPTRSVVCCRVVHLFNSKLPIIFSSFTHNVFPPSPFHFLGVFAFISLHVASSCLNSSFLPLPSCYSHPCASTLFSITSFFSTTSSALHAPLVYCTSHSLDSLSTSASPPPPTCRQSAF